MSIKISNVGTRGLRLGEGVTTTPDLELLAGNYIASAGGYYAGANILVNGKEYAIIIEPDHDKVTKRQWKTTQTATPLANSTFNGRANTQALVDAGINIHPAAKYCVELTKNGFNDWHLPSPDELEVIYRYLKPTTYTPNYTTSLGLHGSNTNGYNPSTNPVGSAYTASSPSQTDVVEFMEGGSQAFNASSYYWSSMNYATNASFSWFQNFDTGIQFYSSKTSTYFVAAVRWVEL